MSKPIAVLISDIHFTPATLELATKSLRLAQEEAKSLKVPLIVAGDTLDTKAIMRAECVNRLIELMSHHNNPPTYVMVGNHDLINEKDAENTLHFLRIYCHVVSSPVHIPLIDAWLAPYFSDQEKLKSFLSKLTPNRVIIMHQGVHGANMGHYVQDKTSLPLETYNKFRVISGHYHARQVLVSSQTGNTFQYIGNPYTLNFGEANDPPKGFQVLLANGTMYHVATNLRKHIIIEWTTGDKVKWYPSVQPDDLVWLKVTGPSSQIKSFSKDEYAKLFQLPHGNFKLELIPTDSVSPQPRKALSTSDTLDSLIDQMGETLDQKTKLKSLWRELCN